MHIGIKWSREVAKAKQNAQYSVLAVVRTVVQLYDQTNSVEMLVEKLLADSGVKHRVRDRFTQVPLLIPSQWRQQQHYLIDVSPFDEKNRLWISAISSYSVDESSPVWG